MASYFYCFSFISLAFMWISIILLIVSISTTSWAIDSSDLIQVGLTKAKNCISQPCETTGTLFPEAGRATQALSITSIILWFIAALPALTMVYRVECTMGKAAPLHEVQRVEKLVIFVLVSVGSILCIGGWASWLNLSDFKSVGLKTGYSFALAVASSFIAPVGVAIGSIDYYGVFEDKTEYR